MAHKFQDLGSTLSSSLEGTQLAAKNDPQMNGFLNSDDIKGEVCTFGIVSGGTKSGILFHMTHNGIHVRAGEMDEAAFVLSATADQWEQFFKQTPEMPFQSYWGLVGMNNRQEGIEIRGDMQAFAHWVSVWRRCLELLHNTVAGPYLEEDQEEFDEDVIVGGYVTLKDIPHWGRSKVYYEKSGKGATEIVFLHTAGSDGRQYNRVMNDPRMLEKCTMYSFDLPAHGKSFPYENYIQGKHTMTEEIYVATIAAFIKKLGLNKPIVCGASMAGQISLACAYHCDKVGCGGTIPMQGSDHLNMPRAWGDQSPFVNQALWNPEWIYGMMAPTAPFKNKQLIWHMYSAQAYGMFHGDLDFYFGGWDGRDRMKDIDTKKCPVYMLTGEYDWSNTPKMSQATCDKIPGGKHQAMQGLGHFPATENPRVFVGYLLTAIDHITKSRAA